MTVTIAGSVSAFIRWEVYFMCYAQCPSALIRLICRLHVRIPKGRWKVLLGKCLLCACVKLK